MTVYPNQNLIFLYLSHLLKFIRCFFHIGILSKTNFRDEFLLRIMSFSTDCGISQVVHFNHFNLDNKWSHTHLFIRTFILWKFCTWIHLIIYTSYVPASTPADPSNICPPSFHSFLFNQNLISFHSKVCIPLSPISAVHMCQTLGSNTGVGNLPTATTTSVQKWIFLP